MKLSERTVEVWKGRIKLRVRVGGNGPPLVYFHPAAGLLWDPFLTRMAEHYTVYAPEFPGTSAGDPYAIHQVEDLWDAVLIYEETLRTLGLQQAVAIGQSFGGMLAAEIAASFPSTFSKLVVIDPIGLWRADAPVANWIAAPPSALPAMLFRDPAGRAAQAMLAMPDDPDARIAAQVALVWAFGCTGKFCWPIPDRGFRKRLHRITVPTLIVWGQDDKLAPVAYAEEFHKLITGSQVALIADCGHIPQVEQMEQTFETVTQFLNVPTAAASG
jgi:pimeloyl-ACP methyl ester carboxylesterase